MKLRTNLKQHILYSLTLLAVVSSLIYLGNYHIDKLKDDYNLKIMSLKQDTNAIEKELQNQLADKQKQIENLSLHIRDTNQKIKETSEQYELQIKKIEETNQQYELQIGELNQQLSDLVVESESFSSVISKVIDSVVSVITNIGQGSGAIISSDGHVVTNYHIIKGAKRASIMTYDGSIHRISLIGYDIKTDLAVLKINSNETFDYLTFENSDSLKAGQKVVALGNPAGLSFTATEGIISSASRKAEDGLSYIQTDVTLNPGNSGGPLINSQGKIIGIVNFKVSGYEGLGFAIPSNRVEEVIEEIINQ